MKTLLLGTTALVASGMLVGASAADIVPAPIPEPVEIEEGFTLSIEADANTGIYFGTTDECEGDPLIGADASMYINDHLADIDYAHGGVSGSTNSGTFSSSCVHDVNANSSSTSDAVYGFHDDGPVGIFWEQKIAFSLESTLASGLFVGVYMEMEKESGDGEKDSWMVMEGNFGTFEIGFTDGAYRNSFAGGLDSGVYAEANGPKVGVFNETHTRDGLRRNGRGDMKVSYYTPRVHGLRFGVTYAPDSSDDDEVRTDNNNHALDSGEEDWVDNWQVGLNWEGTIHDNWEFEIGGGYAAGSAETLHDTLEECEHLADRSDNFFYDQKDVYEIVDNRTLNVQCGDYDVWGVGGVISNGHLSFSAAYTNEEFDFGQEDTNWLADMVVSFDNWNVGFHYGHNEREGYYATDANEFDIFAVGADTELGEGFVMGVYGIYGNKEHYADKIGHMGDMDAFQIGTAFKVN